MKPDIDVYANEFSKETLRNASLAYGGDPNFDITDPDQVAILRKWAIDCFNRKFDQMVRQRQASAFVDHVRDRSRRMKWEEDVLRPVLYDMLRLGLRNTAITLYMEMRGWSFREASARLFEMQLEVDRER